MEYSLLVLPFPTHFLQNISLVGCSRECFDFEGNGPGWSFSFHAFLGKKEVCIQDL